MEKIKSVEILDIVNYEQKPDVKGFVLELDLEDGGKVVYKLTDKENELYSNGFGPEQIMKIDTIGLAETYIINYGKH